ncbi:MAG: transposase, partial [Flavobacteriales bacterium]|nr:transposase [Flavobacteriales bacterium]
MSKNKRRKFSSAFKAKVVLECLSERYSIQELARKYELHPNQISQWKTQFLVNAESVFEKGSTEKSKEETEQEKLYK